MIQIAEFIVAGALPHPMAHSQGRGLPLVGEGRFAADLIRFSAGEGVADHTHPGAHILIVVGGSGWVDYEGEPHRLTVGCIYYVPGGARHAIRAESELTLISVADDHRPVDAPSRLEVCHAPPE